LANEERIIVLLTEREYVKVEGLKFNV